MNMQRVAHSQQPESLQVQMTVAGIKHGQRVQANVAGVFAATRTDVWHQNVFLRILWGCMTTLQSIRDWLIDQPYTIYFCQIKALSAIKTISPGGQGAIPSTMKVDKRILLAVNRFGLRGGEEFDIHAAEFFSNGSIEMTATELTKLVTRGEERRELLVLS